MDTVQIRELSAEERERVSGALWNRANFYPWYTPPTVLYDDGINIRTTDPLTSNVAYDSPFTPIPHPA
jgi:hypothetical protein